MSTHQTITPTHEDRPEWGSTASDLVSDARRMNPVAWRELVHRYSWLVFQWCRNSGLNHEDATDVVQIVFTQVIIYIEGFEKDGEKASFRRWLRTITRSKIAEFHRKSAKQTCGEGGSAAYDRIASLVDPCQAASSSDSGPGPVFDRLWKILEELEDDFEELTWQAFWLTVVEQRKSTEAGRLLNMTPNAVRLAKARVLQRLRAAAGAELTQKKPDEGE
jgi:RNA polymerase sigma-70 factor (ECF subfamily)